MVTVYSESATRPSVANVSWVPDHEAPSREGLPDPVMVTAPEEASAIPSEKVTITMVDVDTSTLWCYEVLPGKPLLKLVAARSWKYDRYLEEYNIDPDTAPPIIEQMVEEQRQRRLESLGSP